MRTSFSIQHFLYFLLLPQWQELFLLIFSIDNFTLIGAGYQKILALFKG